MTNKIVTCTECPNGCQVQLTLDGENIQEISGYLCPRGKKYAENEHIAPRRVLTTTVRTTDGGMLPVKTAAPILRRNLFAVMEKVKKITVKPPVRVGDVVEKHIDEEIDLVATGNYCIE